MGEKLYIVHIQQEDLSSQRRLSPLVLSFRLVSGCYSECKAGGSLTVQRCCYSQAPCVRVDLKGKTWWRGADFRVKGEGVAEGQYIGTMKYKKSGFPSQSVSFSPIWVAILQQNQPILTNFLQKTVTQLDFTHHCLCFQFSTTIMSRGQIKSAVTSTNPLSYILLTHQTL